MWFSTLAFIAVEVFRFLSRLSSFLSLTASIPLPRKKNEQGAFETFEECRLSRYFDLRLTQIAPYFRDGVLKGLTLTEVSTANWALSPDPENGPLRLRKALTCYESSMQRMKKYEEWQKSRKRAEKKTTGAKAETTGAETETTTWDAKIVLKELSEEESVRFVKTGMPPPLRPPFLPLPVPAPKVFLWDSRDGDRKFFLYQTHRTSSPQPLLLVAAAAAVPGSHCPGGPFNKEPPVVSQTVKLLLNTVEEYEAVIFALREAEERLLVIRAIRSAKEEEELEKLMVGPPIRRRARGLSVHRPSLPESFIYDAAKERACGLSRAALHSEHPPMLLWRLSAAGRGALGRQGRGLNPWDLQLSGDHDGIEVGASVQPFPTLVGMTDHEE